MQFEFKIIPADTIETVVPLVKKMSKPHITEALLLERFKEMVSQNYECVGVYEADQLIGVSRKPTNSIRSTYRYKHELF